MIKYSKNYNDIETERLILRALENKDSSAIIENLNDLNVSKWLLVVPYPYTKKDSLWWINHCREQARKKPAERKDYNFGIELRETGKIIGGIGLAKLDYFQGKAEVGYWLGVKYHGQGYGSEALNALLDLAFKKLKLRRLEAGVFAGNPSSGKLLEKYGFKIEGMKRKAVRCKADGKLKDEHIYGLLRSEWRKR
jgi:RimJ/RimL family protein N-acetyltransferase